MPSRGDNVAIVPPTDPPPSPSSGPDSEGSPALVRVGGRNGWRPALLVAGAVVVLLAAAIVKPWETGRPDLARSTPLPGGTDGGLLPAVTSGTAASGATRSAGPTASPSQLTFNGLDLAIMGSTDPHAAWGVAVAYVSRTQFVNAAAGRSPTITPVVSWQLIEMRFLASGPLLDQPPVLDHPGVTSIAIAATWPAEARPIAIRLFYVGPPGSQPTGRPAPSATSEIKLGKSVATRLAIAGGGTPGAGAASGDFYFAPTTLATDPAGWVANGWPVGTYTFQVYVDGGVPRVLPFTILGPPGS